MDWIDIPSTDAQPGDMAEHVSGDLDPREVARIGDGGVWLYLSTDDPAGPFPIEHYDYKREV